MGKGILAGILIALVAFIGGGYAFIKLGCMPANADARPPILERWMAHTSLRAAIRR
jgi:hypothetical protein